MNDKILVLHLAANLGKVLIDFGAKAKDKELGRKIASVHNEIPTTLKKRLEAFAHQRNLVAKELKPLVDEEGFIENYLFCVEKLHSLISKKHVVSERDKYRRLENDLEEYRRKIKSLNDKITDFRNLRDEHHRMIEECNTRNKRLNSAVTFKNERHIQDEDEINDLKGTIKTLRTKVTKTVNKLNKLSPPPKNQKEKLLDKIVQLWIKNTKDERKDQMDQLWDKMTDDEHSHETIQLWDKMDVDVRASEMLKVYKKLTPSEKSEYPRSQAFCNKCGKEFDKGLPVYLKVTKKCHDCSDEEYLIIK